MKVIIVIEDGDTLEEVEDLQAQLPVDSEVEVRG